MDFPVFDMPYIGNRMLVALIAITHVLINHPLAVGAYPLIVLLEYIGLRSRNEAWDRFARQVASVCFVVTTSVGALTGVGIWLATALVAPFAIGSLLRVFFWAWFTEWLVFITEVVLITTYYLTWSRWSNGRMKTVHVATGGLLAIFSWVTMAIIVAILGFMMAPGAWTTDSSLLTAVRNPLYVPQLAFRTSYSMVSGGLFLLACGFVFLRREDALRADVVRRVSAWILLWLPVCAVAAAWYWRSVPAEMQAQLGVGLLTESMAEWQTQFLRLITAAVAIVGAMAVFGAWQPRRLPAVALVVPFVLAVWLLGHFERAREFIRKPYVIADYMYSNGVRVAELPIYQRDGLLRWASFSTVHDVTPANARQAGREVFRLACSRCHTTDGMNNVVTKLQGVLGQGPWDRAGIASFVRGMHVTRTYMPPFPGNAAEADALALYLQELGAGGTR